jgi:hypothetical protein
VLVLVLMLVLAADRTAGFAVASKAVVAVAAEQRRSLQERHAGQSD